jgi:hypothetical protein
MYRMQQWWDVSNATVVGCIEGNSGGMYRMQQWWDVSNATVVGCIECNSGGMYRRQQSEQAIENIGEW